jgi:hypothetical protein
MRDSSPRATVDTKQISFHIATGVDYQLNSDAILLFFKVRVKSIGRLCFGLGYEESEAFHPSITTLESIFNMYSTGISCILAKCSVSDIELLRKL